MAKCQICWGTGNVMKYVRPNVMSSVQCIACRGSGQEDVSASKNYRKNFGVKTNRQIDRAERKRIKREAKCK